MGKLKISIFELVINYVSISGACVLELNIVIYVDCSELLEAGVAVVVLGHLPPAGAAAVVAEAAAVAHPSARPS